jgi:type IV pilus assembly protein PilB
MKLTNNQLKMLLLGANLITYDRLALAEKEATEEMVPLIDYLPQTDMVSSEQLGRVIADALKYKFVNLKEENIDDNIINFIPELMARSKGVIVFAKTEEGVKVGMTDPDDIETIHLIEKKVGQRVLPYYITKQDLNSTLSKYQGSIQKEFDSILEKLRNKSIAEEERDTTIIKVVDILLQYGHQNKASDIHIEPYTDKIVVRFRIDGVLHDVLDIPKTLLDFITSRIKILSKMRTDEHRAAQDGKFRFKSNQEDVDMRVSIVPVSEGEKIVMRILSAQSRRFSLVDLGLNEAGLAKMQKAINNPHGMVLVTGPTGSGKTTSLYAVLKILNHREVNIASIEDPVEYHIEGVNQIQVDTKTNLTFAKGLRAILRQDPDIIMIGEIRDEETANIAINSALTGHLVLSTLHTNDAPTALPRLLDMGIEPFLVSSTVNVVIAQRLVRQICLKCITSYKLSEEDIRLIKNDEHIMEILDAEGYSDLSKIRFYKGNGCKVCNFTGFSGRIGIFEILEMTEEIRQLVVKRASSDEIIRTARKQGMTSMLSDGVEKVFRGRTTLMEIMRVTRG